MKILLKIFGGMEYFSYICIYLIIKGNMGKEKVNKVVEKFVAVHGDKYNYDNIEYKGSQVKVDIWCNTCNEYFSQVPSEHSRGKGCPKCANRNKGSYQNKTNEQWIKEFNEVHNNKYEYIINEQIYATNFINIYCEKHGYFQQRVGNHLQGQGCPKCGVEKNSLLKKSNSEDFIIKSKLVHGDKYGYDEVEYNGSKTKVKIYCNTCNEYFYQRPNGHLDGQGCPKCGNHISSGESEIYNFLKSFNLNIETSKRGIVGLKELDIYLPDYNIAIEFNGLYWHSEKENKDVNYHLNKTIECEKKGIRLIHIFQDEWEINSDIVKSRLMNILKLTKNNIYGRNTIIKEVSAKDSKSFLIENHIQGSTVDKFRYGLYYNNELVSLMTFGKYRKCLGSKNVDGGYELVRFCNKLNTNVIGGASKLFKHFIKTHNPNEVISYADRRWSKGELYQTLGFEQYNISKPNYFYIIKRERKHRFGFRKQVLVEKFGCSIEMTAQQFCYNKGWYRIYDCGCLCYKWTNKKASEN